jgi:outer membrane protein assembly factor BamD
MIDSPGCFKDNTVHKNNKDVGLPTMKKLLSIMLFVCILSSCSLFKSSDDEDNNPYKGMSATQLYDEAQVEIKKGMYSNAAKRLEALDAMYPFSKYAEQAQRDLIYVYYKKGDFPSSEATASRYIHLFPRSKNVDYAYYMKGLANFRQTRGTFAKFLPMDLSWRSPGTMTTAYNDFTDLVRKFPDSQYKPNALQRLIYLRNMFAQRELNAAKYYFDRKMYVASANRASYVIKNYDQAPQKQLALKLLYHSNKKMGLEKAAQEALTVYEATYHKAITPV